MTDMQKMRKALDKHCESISDPVDRENYKLNISHGFKLGYQAATADAAAVRDAALEEAVAETVKWVEGNKNIIAGLYPSTISEGLSVAIRALKSQPAAPVAVKEDG